VVHAQVCIVRFDDVSIILERATITEEEGGTGIQILSHSKWQHNNDAVRLELHNSKLPRRRTTEEGPDRGECDAASTRTS
jgi:hypothetical protein